MDAEVEGGEAAVFGDEDIVRIMVSTDNHLGFEERNPIRMNDSFEAFEEMLTIARDAKVDLVLLAGDLFHENKPSRYTLFRTMEILRKFVFGYNPVRIQVVSDQANIFRGRMFNRVNWEDPHYNVDLPIFSIHGNHDDPIREGDEILAALDLLAVANLINYFGRSDSADHVTLSPIMLVKNKTKVALYGLGNIRDDRFQRMVVNNAVRFQRPADRPEDWFNVFLIHQNRDNRDLRSKTGNNTAEHHLPRFLDLIIWGHEHESFPEVSCASSENATFILQPGSTVATSLSEGETVSLATESGIDPEAADAHIRIHQFLNKKVSQLVERARAELERAPPERRPPPSMQLPLIRLKVDHTGFGVLANQRFGSAFADSVANPGDILMFSKATRSRLEAGAASKVVLPSLPKEASLLKVEDLVAEHLRAAQLALLDDDTMKYCLQKYVEGDSHAIREAVADTLRKRQAAAEQSRATSKEMLLDVFQRERDTSLPPSVHAAAGPEPGVASARSAVDRALGTALGSRARAPARPARGRADSDNDEAEWGESSSLRSSGDEDLMNIHDVPATSSRARARVGVAYDEEDGDSEEARSVVSEVASQVSAARAPKGSARQSQPATRGARAVAARRGKLAAATTRNQDFGLEDGDAGDDHSVSEEEATVARPTRGRARTRGATPGAAARGKRTTTGSKRGRAAVDDAWVEDDVDEGDEVVAVAPAPAPKRAAVAPKQGKVGAAAPKQAKVGTSASVADARRAQSTPRMPWD